MEPIAFILNKKEDYTKRGSARWLPLNGWPLSLSSYPVLTKCLQLQKFNYCLTDCENETYSLWLHVQNICCVFVTNAPSEYMCIHDCLHSFPLAIECLHSFPLTNHCCLGNTVSHMVYTYFVSQWNSSSPSWDQCLKYTVYNGLSIGLS